MTCIVGLVADGRTWIGGDSAGSNGRSVHVRSDTKVFRTGPYVLGFTTSFRMGQLLRYSLTIGEPDTWDVDRFMSTTFIDAVRSTLKGGGWAKAAEGQEKGGTFLVGWRDRLYQIDEDYQVGYDATGYAAVGAGYLVALGSLHTTAYMGSSTPAQRVGMALTAAAEIAEGVRPPFTIAVTEAA